MMELFRPIVVLLVSSFCFAQDTGRNAIFTGYSVRYRYTLRQNGIFLTEVASNATSDSRSSTISGENLWKSELYASQNRDGLGIRRVLRPQLLNRVQTSRTLHPGGTLRFSTPLNINFGTFASFPYLCLKLSKHPSARPSYRFVAEGNNFIVICKSIRAETQSLQTRNSVEFDQYGVGYSYEIQPSTTTHPQTVHVTSVQITTRVAPTSITSSVSNAWKARLFVAGNEDGSGPRVILANQLLNQNQASVSAIPGRTVTFTTNRRFNLDGYGPGTPFPYLCTEFTKSPAANFEFRYRGSQSAVFCGTITSGVADLGENQAEVTTTNTEISFSGVNPTSKTAVANIVYIVRFGDSFSTITGDRLWQLRLYASENDEGTGTRRLLSSQLLNRDQMSTSVDPGGQLRFEINPVVQLEGVGPGTNLPYLCLDFNKHPRAVFEVNYRGSSVITSCEHIPRLIEQTPQAVVRQIAADFSFTPTDTQSTNVITNVNFDVVFDSSSDVIDGNLLWRMGLFASQNPNGLGPAVLISRQLLDEDQVSTGVRPGGQIQFATSDSFDYAGLGLGPGTNLPYICLLLEKHPSAQFELVYGGRDEITACQPLTLSVEQRPRRAVVSGSAADISFSRLDRSSANVITNVNYDVAFDSSSDAIVGNPLWQLMLFASENADGSAPVRTISSQLLDENQISVGVLPGSAIRFSTSESFNFTGLGPGTRFPYFCLTLQKHPSADFELVVGNNNVITGCQPFPLSVIPRTSRAVVRISDADISFRRLDRSSANVITNVNYDVLFDSSSDVIVGNQLWQLMLFVSENADGSDPVRTISSQLLDENQISTDVTPGGAIRFSASKSFDFTGLGPGTRFPYICLSFQKHPSADFELVAGNSNNITGCQPLPLSVVPRTSRAVVRESNADISFRLDPSSTNVITNVIYDVVFDSSSNIIVGYPLWQLMLFASENADGSDPVRTISSQLLDENQISRPVFPGDTIHFSTSESFNFTGLGPVTRFPYICLTLQKQPNADFELVVGNSNNITGCQQLPLYVVRGTPTALVRESYADISLRRLDPSSTNVIISVNYDVLFDHYSDVINGVPLWQLVLFASENADGSGQERTISSQLLDENQISTGVSPDGAIRFTTSESFDFRGLGPGTDLPYICLSLQKNPSADFELVYGDRNVITRCTEMPPFGAQTPKAVIRQSDSHIFFNLTDRDSPYADAVVNYNVTFATSSDVIEGNPLWQLRMFASENLDGTGRRRTISMQLLDESQVSAEVRPGDELYFTTRERVDIRGIGTGSSLPYICLSLQKDPAADFEIAFGDESSVTGCRELNPSEWSLESSDLKLPEQAIVSDEKILLNFTRPDLSNNEITVNINMEVEFDDNTDEIDGNPLWQLRFFASQFKNGTGEQRLITSQLLNQEEMSTGIRPGGRLTIEKMQILNTTDLGPDTQLPYICVALNQHPRANFELVNRDSDVVMACEALPLFQAPESEETKTCRIWGDPHQKTFDGYGYSFQGEDEYVAVKTCKDNDGTVPEFRIIAENYRRRPSKPVTYIRELRLEYNGVLYSLVHPSTILVDGVEATSPFSDENGVKIQITPPHQVLTTQFGLVMRLDEEHNSDITLPVKFANKVCGICGNFDGIRGNECHFPDGTSMEMRNEDCKENFTKQWVHNTTEPPLPYREHIKPLTQCGEGSSLLATAEDKCGILIDPAGPLAACHEFVSPDFYYETCIFDLCQLLPFAFPLCGHVEAYILECSHATGGTVEVGHWRDVTGECELYCGEGMTFTYRGNPCPPTCTNPEGTKEDCPFPFLESCQCDEGKVLDGTRCVDITECGCKMENGRYLSIGEEIMNPGCSESCLCTENGELQCTNVTCVEYSECSVKSGKRDCYCQEGYAGHGREECTQAVRSCRIYGDPHFNTFDQAFYSFQGDCWYTAVKTCKALPGGALPFQIHIHNDALVPDERYTYITVVRLHYGKKFYKITYTGKVTLDGVNIANDLPFHDLNAGVHISKNKNSVLLHTDTGLQLNMTSDTELTIKVPPVYFGKVCGLCGNADGNSTNDKQLPDGTLGKKLPFANSWSVGSCEPLDEPVESCVVGSDNEATAIDICSELVRKDGPFSYCYDFRDPTDFYKSCVFDLCATLPSTELFCISANQYLQACMENGGSVQGDWKKDVEYCFSVDCPEGYTAFKGSCYKHYRTKKNYEQSKNFCREDGGHLVTITSRPENVFVSRLAGDATSWIGAERNHSASYNSYTSYGNQSYTFLPDPIPEGVGSIRFGVAAQSNAYVLLSPTRNPDENTPLYEFAIGANQNKKTFIRRCMGCSEEDSSRKSLLKKEQERRFFINFHDGIIRMGRLKKRDILLEYRDQNPIVVKYIAFKTVGTDGTWTFYGNEFIWITNETWSYDNYRFGEPSNFDNREHCLETNYDSKPGTWNDHFCSLRKTFVCEVEGEH